MKRFYVCDVIGAGTEADPYRPAIADHAVSWAAVIKSDAQGRPAKPWALVVASADDHRAMLDDARLDVLPGMAMDAPMRNAPAAVRTRLQARLAARLTGVVMRDDETLGMLARRIGSELEPAFDETKLHAG